MKLSVIKPWESRHPCRPRQFENPGSAGIPAGLFRRTGRQDACAPRLADDLALLEQQVVSFHDDLLAGFEAVANLDPVIALNAGGDHPLLISPGGQNKDYGLAVMTEHRGLENGDS